MRKQLFGVFFLLALAFTSRGFGSDLVLGLKGGLNMAKVSTCATATSVCTDAESTKIMFGGFIDYEILPWLYLSPELMYAGQGTSLSYLRIPVFFKAMVGLGLLKPYVMVGPDSGVKLSGTGVKGLDVALTFGGGTLLSIAPAMSLVFDFRYMMGLSDIADPVSATSTTKNKGFQILGGLAFDL